MRTDPREAGAFFQLGAVAVQQDKIQEGLRLMAIAAIILRSIKSDEVKNVEPLVERLAAQLGLHTGAVHDHGAGGPAELREGQGMGAGREGLGEIGRLLASCTQILPLIIFGLKSICLSEKTLPKKLPI